MPSVQKTAAVLMPLLIMGGCKTVVESNDSSAPTVELTYSDANTRSGTFGDESVALALTRRNPAGTLINARARDPESGIASVELTIDAEVNCRGVFPGLHGHVNWPSRARWTVNSGRAAAPGTTDYVAANAIAYLTPERLARKAECFTAPDGRRTTVAYVSILGDASAFARACNNGSEGATRCSTARASFSMPELGSEQVDIGD